MYGISLVKLCNFVRFFFFCKEIVVKVRGICSFFSEVVYGFHKFKVNMVWYSGTKPWCSCTGYSFSQNLNPLPPIWPSWVGALCMLHWGGVLVFYTLFLVSG